MLKFIKLKFTKKYFFVFGIVIFLLFLSSIIIYASFPDSTGGAWDTGYRVDNNVGTNIIDVNVGAVDGDCHEITNTSGNSYFIPTKTTAEWDAFAVNSPSGVTIGECSGEGYLHGYGCDSCPWGSEVIYIYNGGVRACKLNGHWGTWRQLDSDLTIPSWSIYRYTFTTYRPWSSYNGPDESTTVSVGAVCYGLHVDMEWAISPINPNPAVTTKVICTELYEKGMLSETIFKADVKHASIYFSKDALVGYHAWGVPMVKVMRAHPEFYKMIAPLAQGFARESAYRIGEYESSNDVGKLLIDSAIPLCEEIGKYATRQAPISLFSDSELFIIIKDIYNNISGNPNGINIMNDNIVNNMGIANQYFTEDKIYEMLLDIFSRYNDETGTDIYLLDEFDEYLLAEIALAELENEAEQLK